MVQCMSKQALIAGGIALLVVIAAIGSILFSTRKNRLELTGEFLKVRSHQVEPDRTIALVDVRLTNPSTQQFVVREIEVFVQGPDGESTSAGVFSEPEIRRMVDYYKVLGEKHNPGLLQRDQINPGETIDRTIGISVPMSDARFANRKALRIVAHDVDRKSTEIVEQR